MKSLFAIMVLVIAWCLGLTFPGQSAPKQAAPTSAEVKAFILKREKRLATGVGSQHKSVSLIFESVRFGTARKATARDRITNGITGPMVYPVRAKYISHRTWGNGETEDKKIHYDYEFYKDAYGDWDAYFVGPVSQ